MAPAPLATCVEKSQFGGPHQIAGGGSFVEVGALHVRGRVTRRLSVASNSASEAWVQAVAGHQIIDEP